jgi:hypothetical protein
MSLYYATEAEGAEAIKQEEERRIYAQAGAELDRLAIEQRRLAFAKAGQRTMPRKAGFLDGASGNYSTVRENYWNLPAVEDLL